MLSIRPDDEGIEMHLKRIADCNKFQQFQKHFAQYLVVKVGGIGWDRKSFSSEYIKCAIPF